jgi:hypothetical protein
MENKKGSLKELPSGKLPSKRPRIPQIEIPLCVLYLFLTKLNSYESGLVDIIWLMVNSCTIDDVGKIIEGKYQNSKTLFGRLIIPRSVTTIGGWAFQGCIGLTSVAIPNTVTSIEEYAFAYIGLTSVTIPSSVSLIEDGAFLGCSGLTSVTIPSSVTSIEKEAFAWCTGLTSVTIPSSVTSIGKYAFDGCSGLTSVTIPSSVTSIGEYAFDNCSGLICVSIPSTLTDIGEDAFPEECRIDRR